MSVSFFLELSWVMHMATSATTEMTTIPVQITDIAIPVHPFLPHFMRDRPEVCPTIFLDKIRLTATKNPL